MLGKGVIAISSQMPAYRPPAAGRIVLALLWAATVVLTGWRTHEFVAAWPGSNWPARLIAPVLLALAPAMFVLVPLTLGRLPRVPWSVRWWVAALHTVFGVLAAAAGGPVPAVVYGIASAVMGAAGTVVLTGLTPAPAADPDTGQPPDPGSVAANTEQQSSSAAAELSAALFAGPAAQGDVSGPAHPGYPGTGDPRRCDRCGAEWVGGPTCWDCWMFDHHPDLFY